MIVTEYFVYVSRNYYHFGYVAFEMNEWFCTENSNDIYSEHLQRDLIWYSQTLGLDGIE